MWEVLSNQQITGIIIRECFEAAVLLAAMLQQGRTGRLQLAAKMKKIRLNGRGKGWNLNKCYGGEIALKLKKFNLSRKPRQGFLN